MFRAGLTEVTVCTEAQKRRSWGRDVPGREQQVHCPLVRKELGGS